MLDQGAGNGIKVTVIFRLDDDHAALFTGLPGGGQQFGGSRIVIRPTGHRCESALVRYTQHDNAAGDAMNDLALLGKPRLGQGIKYVTP